MKEQSVLEVVEEVKLVLSDALCPTYLAVHSESDQHIGHAYPAGMFHLVVRIASPMFDGQSLLNCHRLVYGALHDIICRAIHALKIEVIRDLV